MECKAPQPEGLSCSSDGINRNIVECKDWIAEFISEVVEVLIETLWNVKQGLLKNSMEWAKGINRNIVECKARNNYAGYCPGIAY